MSKTIKKLLPLALALALMLTLLLLLPGTAQALTNADEVQYNADEVQYNPAVEFLTELGDLGVQPGGTAQAATTETGGLKPGDYGYNETQLLIRLGLLVGIDEQGTVAGDMTLNRYTATTFVFRISTGETGADIYKRDTVFPDVTGSIWAVGYVNWAASQNPPIIKGRADGTFDGDVPVQLAEYCAMLTRALGLSDENTPYPDGVITIAQKAGLLENIGNKKAYDKLTRIETIIITYNALFAVYDTQLITDADNKVIAKDMTLITEVFGAEAQTAYVSGTSTALLVSDISRQGQVELTYFTADMTPGVSQTFDYAGNADDLLFRKVTAYVRPGSTGGPGELLALRPADNTVITAKAGAFSADSSNWQIRFNGTNYTGIKQFGGQGTGDNYKAYTVNYRPTTPNSISAVLGVCSDTMVTLINWGGSDTAFDAIIVEQPKTEQVLEITSTYIRTNSGMYRFEDADNNVIAVAYEGMAVNDWVYVYPRGGIVGNNKGMVYYIEKADVLSEAVYTAKSSGSNPRYTLGGAQYTAQQVPLAQGLDALVENNMYDVVLNSVGDIFKIIIDPFIVAFKLNYSGAPDGPAKQSVGSGGLVTRPANPSRSGYSFGGWYTKDGSGNDWGQEWNFATDTVSANTTLYARWTVSSSSSGGGGGGGGATTYYTVTFNLNGATGTAPANQSVAAGGYATPPTTPTRSGYTFGGWYTEAACTTPWNFTTSTVTASITLYAKWTDNTTPPPVYVAQYSWQESGGSGMQTYTQNYTTLKAALEGAAIIGFSGTVKLLQGYNISEDLTVPSGVTLVVPADKTLTLSSGTLTIDMGGSVIGTAGATFVYSGGTLSGAGFTNFYYPDVNTPIAATSIPNVTYKWVTDAGGSGSEGWQLVAEAKIGTTYYATLADALTAGGNVTLVADCSIGNANISASYTLTVPSGKTLTVTGTLSGEVGAKLEVAGTLNVTGTNNFYDTTGTPINTPISPGTYDWDTNADGQGIAGWLEQP